MYISCLKAMHNRVKLSFVGINNTFIITDEEKIWPPCIRVIVIRSPVLQTGSLYIITAVKPATIGR